MAYLVHSKEAREEILRTLDLPDEAALFSHIPASLHKKTSTLLEKGLDEFELLRHFENLLSESGVSLKDHACGYGLYRHRISLAVDHLASQREFVTSYTPYQAEVAQGTLQALFEYQSLLSILTGLPITNASLYDGSTSLVEAVRMAMRQKGLTKPTVYFSSGVNPRYEETFKTYFAAPKESLSLTLTRLPYNKESGATEWPREAADIIVVQNPHYLGVAEPLVNLKERYPKAAVVYLTTEALSLTVLEKPTDWGAEIVCGEAQSLGMPVSYSGPGLGFLATTNEYLRNMPGRLVGKTLAKGEDGNPTDAYVITLATREQHIRREKATSNICSNQTLMAVRAAIFMASLGWGGMQRLLALSMEKAFRFQKSLLKQRSSAVLLSKGALFHEVFWQSENLSTVIQACAKEGFFPGVQISKNTMLSYFHDDFSDENQDKLVSILKKN